MYPKNTCTMLRLFCFSFLLMLLGKADGQRMYSIVYIDSQQIQHNALLVYFSSNNCYVRTATKDKDGNNSIIMAQSQSISSINRKGVQYFYIKPIETPYVVAADTTTHNDTLYGYQPDIFIWYTQPNGTKTGPLITKDSLAFNHALAATSYAQLDPDSVSIPFMEQFYWPSEGLYYDMLVMCNLLPRHLAVPLLTTPPTLHFIMAANTIDKKIGASCAKDLEQLGQELKKIAGLLHINYKTYIIGGKAFSRKNLIASINQVKADSNDIIIFSYSGHGSRWDGQKTAYPFMNLWTKLPFADGASMALIKKKVNENSMNLADVYQMIIKKPSRLNIVLGDLCNNAIGVPRPVNQAVDINDFSRSGVDFIIRSEMNLQVLFLGAKGNILSVATKPYELASGTKAGGYFTNSFIAALQAQLSYSTYNPNWNTLTEDTFSNAYQLRKNAQSTGIQSGLRTMDLKMP